MRDNASQTPDKKIIALLLANLTMMFCLNNRFKFGKIHNLIHTINNYFLTFILKSNKEVFHG